MSRWTVTAERTPRGVWVLECAELGAVSQCTRLAQAPDEMREALAYLSGQPVDEIEVDVIPVLPENLKSELAALDDARRALEDSQKAVASGLRAVALGLTQAGLSYRDAGNLLGVSHQRVAQLVAA